MAPEDDPENDLATDLARTGRELTSGPPCRACGAPMETGFLQVRSGAPIVTEIRWMDPDDRTGGPGETVETLPWGPFGRTHSLRGFRCPECKRLEVAYGPLPPKATPETVAVPRP